jgi:hypothetical protein
LIANGAITLLHGWITTQETNVRFRQCRKA